MRISTKGEYGVRAMYDLAVHYGSSPIPLRAIAERQAISEPYLEQLLGTLRKAGLVKSVRGAAGGYKLAAAPEEITIGELIRALEGPISPMECVDEDSNKICGLETECVFKGLWKRLRDSMTEVLDTTTLADLVAEAGKRSEEDKNGRANLS